MTSGYYTVLGPAKRYFYVRLQSRVLDLVFLAPTPHGRRKEPGVLCECLHHGTSWSTAWLTASTPRDFYRGPPR
jgi:hypothetical protein